VPFIVSWPAGKVPQGKTSRALVSQIDAMRSLAAVVGEQLADSLGIDSRDHHRTWLGLSSKPRNYVVSMAYNRSVSIRTPQWKYIVPTKGPAMVPWGPHIETGFTSTAQLYNMRGKQGETTNVAEKHPKIVKQLDEQLKKELESPQR